MDADQLRTFERIVREGSFSRAAWSLGVAQPTVSARVQALEQAVGGPLFARTGRGASLTDLGTSFLPYVRRALEVLDAGLDVARQTREGQRGRVTIGVLESLSGTFLGPALVSLHADHPDLDVLVRAGRQEQLAELLHDGVVSLALLASPHEDSLTADTEVLMTLHEPVVLVVGRTHALARRRPFEREAVLRLARPFILLRWWLSLPPALEELARRARPAVEVPMETGRQLVLGGVGAAYFPWMQVTDLVREGRLVVVEVTDVPPLDRWSVLVRRVGGAPLSPAALALVERIRQRAAALRLLAPDA